MLKYIMYIIIFLCLCISAEAQKLNKDNLYADAICRLHKIQLQAQYLNTSDTLYVITNNINIEKKINMVSNKFPQLKTGESFPVYILNPMEMHKKRICVKFNICQLIQKPNSKRRIVSSGTFIFFYKVKKGKYYYCTYKNYGI